MRCKRRQLKVTSNMLVTSDIKFPLRETYNDDYENRPLILPRLGFATIIGPR